MTPLGTLLYAAQEALFQGPVHVVHGLLDQTCEDSLSGATGAVAAIQVIRNSRPEGW